MSIEIQCPSGMRFRARLMKVRELRDLAVAAETNASDGGLTGLLSACWEELVQPSPAYPFMVEGSQPDWQRVLDGDVTVALLRLRRATLGPLYDFVARCGQCGRQQPKDLTVDIDAWQERPYPEAALAACATGAPLEARMLDGTVVRYSPQVIGQHAKLVAAKKRWQSALSRKFGGASDQAKKALRPQEWDWLVRQVSVVETLGERSRDSLALIEWADDLDLGEYYHLRDQIMATEGGVDTTVKFTCQFANCEWEQEANVPFAGGFFRPPLKTRPVTEEDGPPAS